MKHTAGPSGSAGWTRNYQYATDSNRLLFTSVPGSELSLTEAYLYDNHGSMQKMPHLAALDWDYADRLKHTRKTNGDVQDTYFTYDATGQRVRKVFVTAGAIKERIYLGGYEIYRERANSAGSTAMLERQTLHVMDDQRRIALVETKTRDGGADVAVPLSLWRFQLDNHLGSSMVEIDHVGSVISYEEYHPYGSTAFQVVDGNAEVSAKRYRYTTKERDEETGLYYHGARYYAPWLGRWTAADPSGLKGGPNQFAFVSGNPVNLVDADGREGTPWWRFNQAGGWYPTGKHDIFTPHPGVETGSIPLNIVQNSLLTLSNLATIPFNAVTEAAAVPEEIARSLGATEMDIAAMNFALLATGVGEVNAAPGLFRELTAATKGAQKLKQTAQVVQKVEQTAQVVQKVEQTAQVVQKAEQTAQTVQKVEQTAQTAKKIQSAAEIPSVKGGAFAKWFNEISVADFEKLWANRETRQTIQARLRAPGGMHEWLLVARANVFKNWGVTAEEVAELRTAIDQVRFVNPAGRHGAAGSTAAHNELLRLIDSSGSYGEFAQKLQTWASTRLEGGVSSLPSGLRPR